jgi:hypothetical protein
MQQSGYLPGCRHLEPQQFARLRTGVRISVQEARYLLAFHRACQEEIRRL